MIAAAPESATASLAGPSSERADAVRGGAALVVAVAHMWQIFLYPLTGDTLTFDILGGMASWAVAIFFLLSGMLIALSVRRRRAAGFRFGDYMLARIIRIFPPLFASVALTLGCVAVIQGFELYGSEAYLLPGDLAAAREKAEIHWPSVLPTLLLTYWLIPSHSYIFFNGPLWSLSYEFWAYVLAGFCAAALYSRSVVSGALALALAGWIVLFAYPLFTTILIVWGLGFTAGYAWSAIGALRPAILIAAGIVLVAVSALFAGSDFAVLLTDGRPNAAFYICMSAALLCAMLVLVRKEGPAGPVIRTLVVLSRSSYTLYLIHFPTMLLMLSLLRPLVHSHGLAGNALLGIVSLGVSVFLADRIARVAENRALWRRIALRAWPAGNTLPVH